MYSRKVMPDVFSVSFVIISLYFAFNYFKENKRLDLFSYFIFVTIGVLSKIPAAYLIVVLLFPLIDGSIKTKQKIHIIFATSIMFIQVGWWYFYWVLYLINHFEYSNYPT
jgi:4-amino-4-deoxy-L-arabinose transferase-like glycosyltransferase